MYINPYTLWNIYICMRTFHGVYITYHFFKWVLGSIGSSIIYIISFVYNPYEIPQIKDKKEDIKIL